MSYQAIVTKYHGPSNVKGSRVSATCQAGRVMVSYDCGLNSEDAHAKAAKALCEKLNKEFAARHPESNSPTPQWDFSRMHAGALPDESGYAFVIV